MEPEEEDPEDPGSLLSLEISVSVEREEELDWTKIDLPDISYDLWPKRSPTKNTRDWDCSFCNFWNTAEALTCRLCDAKKSTFASLDSITITPPSSASREDIPQDIRKFNVNMLVWNMSTGDPAEDWENLVTQAQNIEKDIYESVNSRDEYLHLLNEKKQKYVKTWISREMKQIDLLWQCMGQRSTPAIPLGTKRIPWSFGVSAPARTPPHLSNEPGPSDTNLDSITATTPSAVGMRKSWHKDISQIFRDSKVTTLVEDLSLTPNTAEHTENWVTQAQNIERGIYESANSEEEYCHLMDKKINELREKWQSTITMYQLVQMRMQSMGRRSTTQKGILTPKSSAAENTLDDKKEWSLFGPPLTTSDSPRIQSQTHAFSSSALEPIKHLSSTETASLCTSISSDSTIGKPHMVSPPRTQEMKRRIEELNESDPLSSTPSSTSLNKSSSTTQVSHLPRKRRKETEIHDSDILFSQDAPDEIITPPMLSSPNVSPGEIMSCESTTDHPVTVSLSPPHPSLEVQDETRFRGCRTGESISLPRSRSLSSLSHIPRLKRMSSFRAKRSHSLNDVTLLDKTERITPDIIIVENEERYRYHCTQAGLFQCSVTGLVFKMEAEGDVIYRTVPWNRRLLSQLGKRPAGPLFDIKSPQWTVCQLQLPHCEILSTGGGKLLSVLHVTDEAIDIIDPHVITETHVIINVTGCSLYGVLNEADSTNPIRAFVALFYTPPNGDDDSTLKVLLLPENVVLSEVIKNRREIHGEEIYIEKPPCKLIPNQEYTLSTSPQDDSITIEPPSTEFEAYDSYQNYVVTFEVILEGLFKRVTLLLSNNNTSNCQWRGCVKLSRNALRKEQVQHTLSLAADNRLFSVRSSFISRVSLPNLNSVLDKLLEKMVITNSELAEANGKPVKEDKARFVIDTVRQKGVDASSIMIFILCETDPFLSEHLGLM